MGDTYPSHDYSNKLTQAIIGVIPTFQALLGPTFYYVAVGPFAFGSKHLIIRNPSTQLL